MILFNFNKLLTSIKHMIYSEINEIFFLRVNENIPTFTLYFSQKYSSFIIENTTKNTHWIFKGILLFVITLFNV